MKPPRISLAGLMAFVLFVAIQAAALISGTPELFRAIYTLTVLALILATLAARFRGPFWYGFAAVGWGYFLVGLPPWSSVYFYCLSRSCGLIFRGASCLREL